MKIYLDMVGCRLNQAEIEQMAGQFRAAGHTLVGSIKEADTMVLNTCSVTAKAASDSRQKVRQAARAGVEDILLTGCWSTLQPIEAAALPNVVRVIPNGEKDSLVWDYLGGKNPETRHIGEGIDGPHPMDLEPLSRTPLPGLRQRTRAFIKVQDGCNNSCSFCITTVARGVSRSRPPTDVIAEIQAALQAGVMEVVLTGVHLGSWGQDFGMHLRDLIQRILHEVDIPRLRLSSLEPWDLDEEFFRLWSDPRLCPHLHLPLQSGSGATLKRMLRKTTPASFRSLVEAARSLIPGVSITTDLIAGFPSESEIEFAETLDFVREINFAGGHIFSYSLRPGTPAARIKSQVPGPIIHRRSQILKSALAESTLQYRKGFLGRTLPVLWEASAVHNEHGWQIEGLTSNYLRVTAQAPMLRWNQLDSVELNGLTSEGLSGIILPKVSSI